MSKTKVLQVCKKCGSNEALFITLGNGEKLPSYVMRIGDGIYCNKCAKEGK